MNKNLITGFVAGNIVTLAALFTAGAIYKNVLLTRLNTNGSLHKKVVKANRKRIAH